MHNPRLGVKLTGMSIWVRRCPACRSKAQRADRFCGRCGSRLEDLGRLERLRQRIDDLGVAWFVILIWPIGTAIGLYGISQYRYVQSADGVTTTTSTDIGAIAILAAVGIAGMGAALAIVGASRTTHWHRALYVVAAIYYVLVTPLPLLGAF